MKEILVNSSEEKNTILYVEDGNLLEKYEEYIFLINIKLLFIYLFIKLNNYNFSFLYLR